MDSSSLAGILQLPREEALARRRAYWHEYKRRPENVARIHAKEEQRTADRVLQRYKQAKTRAGLRGVPFELTYDDCRPAVAACEMCAAPFDKQCLPSIDRIVPATGYVPGNIGWLCLTCNGWKYRRTDADVEALLANDCAVRHRHRATTQRLAPLCLAYLRRHNPSR